MGRQGDFVIENGVLKAYEGTEKDLVIPSGVTAIGEYSKGVTRSRASSFPTG